MIKTISLIFFALILIQAARVTHDAGILRPLEEVSWGQCEQITGPMGGEDLTIDPIQGIAYIGSDPRRDYLISGDMSQAGNGALWYLDLNDPYSQAQKITTDISGPFHPHGISLRMDEQGAIELYVMNHLSPTEHEVDIFTVKAPGQLTLKRRISFPEMISPNDLAVAGEDRFFMTNDHGNPRHTVMEVLEDYLGLPLSNVVYYDGAQAHIIAEGLRMANGVQLSADQKTLYVAETTGRRITRFQQGASMLEWIKQDSIDVDSGVDNLEWDQQGRLLTGAHPKLFAFLGHMKDASSLSPSEAIRINVAAQPMEYETILLDDGSQLSGSSVAATYGEQLIMGPVFDPHILRCQK